MIGDIVTYEVKTPQTGKVVGLNQEYAIVSVGVAGWMDKFSNAPLNLLPADVKLGDSVAWTSSYKVPGKVVAEHQDVVEVIDPLSPSSSPARFLVPKSHLV